MSEWKWCCATWRRVLPCRSGRFRSAVLPWSAPPHLSTPHLHSTAKSEREATAALADSHLFGPHSGPHRLGPGGRRGVWRAERNSAAAPACDAGACLRTHTFLEFHFQGFTMPLHAGRQSEVLSVLRVSRSTVMLVCTPSRSARRRATSTRPWLPTATTLTRDMPL